MDGRCEFKIHAENAKDEKRISPPWVCDFPLNLVLWLWNSLFEIIVIINYTLRVKMTIYPNENCKLWSNDVIFLRNPLYEIF